MIYTFVKNNLKSLLGVYWIVSSVVAQESTMLIDILKNANAAAWQIIHHNPAMELYSCKTDLTDYTRIFVYFHGWGDRKEAAKSRKKLLNLCGMHESIMMFNFRDACIDGNMALTQTNLGQLPDVLTALYVLKTCMHMGVKIIDCIGNSRGGATVINMIGILSDTNHTYDMTLANIGIDEEMRFRILCAIKEGSVILEQPLVDVWSSLIEGSERIRFHIKKQLFGSWFQNNPWIKKIGKAIDQGVVWPIYTMIVPLLTHYHPSKYQPLILMKGWPADIKVIVHMQRYDHVVSNKAIAQFVAERYSVNPDHTYCLIGAHTGGHYGEATQLYQFMSVFRKKYGGSYDEKFAQRYNYLLERAGRNAQHINTYEFDHR